MFSGENGDRLLRLEGEAAGDNLGKAVGFVRDGDGRDEIIVGAWKADKADPVTDKKIKDTGAVYVASKEGVELSVRKFEGEAKNDLFGFSVAANDVSGDGKADAVIGAYRHDVPIGDKKLSDAGSVYVYSLTDGSRIAQFDGAHAKDWLGYAVATAHVDGDDYADVLAGAPKEDFFPAPPQKTVKDAGTVHVYSGAGKNLLYSAHHSAPQASALFGSAVADAGQPLPDTQQHNFVVGAYKYDAVIGGKKKANAGRVTLHRASDGAELFSIDGDGKNNSFGFAVSSGRYDTDAYPDLIVGSYLGDPVATKTIADGGVADVVTGIIELDKRTCTP